MLEHIVKNNEHINDILNMYHLELDELRECNFHITDFYNLMPGTKIKIPVISKEVEQVLEKTESFVMDYYPKVETLISANKEKVLENNKENEEKKVVEYRNAEPKGKAYPGILPPRIRK